ncbi:MAG: butyrate kinase [Bacteroidales bacterium]|nr:butyrate kinase [Bacteroidales bacterium]MBQ6688206.1 butyrate kinase [Bacteroidales bacterium]
MKGRILVVNTGSTSTKIGFYDSGEKLFEQNLTHTAEEVAKYESVMDQGGMRRDSITDFLVEKGIALDTIDVVMARGGLITPIRTGVYEVNKEMRDALMSGKDGVHACNLSALIADDIAVEVNKVRMQKGMSAMCRAYIADPPMADEMLDEVKVGGLPEFPRRTLFHALNSRAMVRRYARSVGKTNKDVTVIVAHMGGGTSVSLHRNGLVIDTNDALGGDGPITPERAGSVPAFPLVEMCFSGKYTKDEVKKKLVGKGGAVAYFGTNDFREISARAEHDDAYAVFLKGYSISVAKYIAAVSVVVSGKVDAIVLTGGIAHNDAVVEDIRSRVSFIAPVEVYAGENELESLAENGYGILSGEFDIRYYHPDHF